MENIDIFVLVGYSYFARRGRAKAADPTEPFLPASHRQGGDAYGGDKERKDWR